ncbi:MAG: branched-chain amino acid ABC transporter ATP-binding protein [SAR86 cluster bacterium]|uniref:Branched-chain amino acid ABC transporter ATP-binding protein n=1 Tax=SAR86 cluster bacterium TaxID=2030880 RepID=A0A2A5C8H8_9GAMM|nr:MAG: branched-chain amino acid ABC transporter ATP-binding protein [SAR86 cluster bacterium]
MLKLSNVYAGYGGVDVLHELTVEVQAGEFVAVVGPNGAGKSTLFKTISGLITPSSGSIEFLGQDLLAVSAAKRAHLGIAHVPEGRQVFASMTIYENLEMGAYTRAGQKHWQDNLEKIYNWFPILKERQSQLAGTLSGGQQQMLAIARGLAAHPKILLLDEPSMGLSPAIADEIFERLIDIHKNSDISLMLVEQRVAEALHFASRAYVLEAGRIILSGDQDALRDDDRIRQAYLGM